MKRAFKNESGFTLTEIISVLGLTLLLTLIIYNLFIISQKAFSAGDRQLEITQNGRIFLDRLSRELRQTEEIVTALPATKDVEGFPPATEIEFQDGHGLPDIQYLRYYVDSGQVKRLRKVYFFETEPETYVYWNAQDEFGQPPSSLVVEERLIAEYVSDLDFYGSTVTYIEVWLNKQNSDLHLYTGVWGRNTRL